MVVPAQEQARLATKVSQKQRVPHMVKSVGKGKAS